MLNIATFDWRPTGATKTERIAQVENLLADYDGTPDRMRDRIFGWGSRDAISRLREQLRSAKRKHAWAAPAKLGARHEAVAFTSVPSVGELQAYIGCPVKSAEIRSKMVARMQEVKEGRPNG